MEGGTLTNSENMIVSFYEHVSTWRFFDFLPFFPLFYMKTFSMPWKIPFPINVCVCAISSNSTNIQHKRTRPFLILTHFPSFQRVSWHFNYTLNYAIGEGKKLRWAFLFAFTMSMLKRNAFLICNSIFIAFSL